MSAACAAILVATSPLAHVMGVRQAQVLGRCHVAEEIRPARSCDGPTDGRRDVIVAGSDIGHERPEYVEGRPMAQALLHLHVGGNLVERHVPRPLDHHLHAGIPRALRELADFDELGDLGGVACIVDATGRIASPREIVTSCSCRMASTSS